VLHEVGLSFQCVKARTTGNSSFSSVLEKGHTIKALKVEVQAKIMLRPMVSRPVYLGFKPASGTPRPNFCYFQAVADFCCGTTSDERICRLHLLLALAKSRGTQTEDSPNLEGHVSVFTSPRSRVAPLYPQAMGSLFVASYDSQGYGGGIRTRLHASRFSTTDSDG
jgi:hypothetical protein